MENAVDPAVETPNKKRWLSVFEAAEHIGTGKQTVRNLLHDGRLPASRLGPHFRIDVNDLDNLLLRLKRTVAPYRRGTRPWVKARHAAKRKAAAK